MRYLKGNAAPVSPDCDALVRLVWEGGPPSEKEWNDANFFLAETLRDHYDPRNIIRMEFRALPNTEDEYEVTVEAVTSSRTRLHGVRRPKQKKPTLPRQHTSEKPEPVRFCLDPIGYDLPSDDKEILVRFNRMPLDKRIRFWQKHVAPFCK